MKHMEDKEDTRAKLICLTKKGKELISKLIPIVEKVDDNFFGSLKKSDHSSLIGILNGLVPVVNSLG